MHGYLDNTDGHPGHVKTSITTEGQCYNCHLVTRYVSMHNMILYRCQLNIYS